MPDSSSFVSRFPQWLLSLIALVFGLLGTASSHAIPQHSAAPGSSGVSFDVGQVHRPTTGAFTDRYAFELMSDASLRSTSLYFSSDIAGFVVMLYGDAGLIAAGTSSPIGDPQDESMLNSMFVPRLAGGKQYEIRVSGDDRLGDLLIDFGPPYSLSLQLGPVVGAQLLSSAEVPEPPALALFGAALLLLAVRRKNRSNGYPANAVRPSTTICV